MKKIVCLLVIGLILIGSVSNKEENLVKNNILTNYYEQMKKRINTLNQSIATKDVEIQSKPDFKGKNRVIVNGEERKKIRQYVDSENSKNKKQREIEENNAIKHNEEKEHKLKQSKEIIKSTDEEVVSNKSNQAKIGSTKETKGDAIKNIDIAPTPKKEKIESSPKQNEKQKPKANTVGINGLFYSFKNLSINTNAAQSYIDKNPNAFGLWKNVTYVGEKMNIMFGHDYGSGKLVKSAKVGDTLILSDENGNLVHYSVVSKVVVSVQDYYSDGTKLWKTVGKNFDLMIKTCEKRNVTDLVITLQRIRE